MDVRRRLPVWCLALLGAVFICFGLWASSSGILSSHGVWHGQQEAVQLPWKFQQTRANNRLLIELHANFFSPKVWHIIPDDQLTALLIDDQAIPLGAINPAALMDFNKGFEIDLSSYLTPGQHRIELQFNNRYSVGSMSIEPVWGFWRYACIYIGVLLWVLALSALFKLTLGQKWVVALALVPIFFYWSATPWDVRAHDVSWGGGHFDYIEYVATQKAIPKPHEGWIYYHPPTYYFVGAAVWLATEASGLPVHETLQLVSIIFWLIFLISSMATFNLFLRRQPGALLVASLAIALWPAGIIHSPAIGNDSALYACIGLATFFMCRWWFNNRRRDVLLMALFCSLSVLVKSNGMVVIAAAGLLLLLHFFLRPKRKKLRAFNDGVLFGSIALTGLLASLATRIYYFVKGETPNWMITNVGNLHSGLRVPADIKAFLPLDIPTFLTQPYVHSFNNETGRESFWIFLLRSSLTGEFSFSNPILTTIAYIWGLVLLGLFLNLLYHLPQVWRTHARVLYRYLPLLLLGFLWLASLIALRIQVPFACSNDFRYIVPILLPVIVFWVTRGAWSRALLLVMSLCSLVFYTGVGLISY